MAELNLPSHRWHQKQNHVRLALEDFSRQYIYDSGLRRIDGHIMKKDGYAIGADSPNFLADFKAERYYADTIQADFLGAIEHSRNGNATMTDSDGLLKWAPHNLITYSEDFSNAAWSSVSVSVSSSSSASPSRAVTADLVESTISSTGSVGVYQNASVKAGIKYTFSVWVKAGTVDKGYLQYTGSNEFLFFDLETQSASTSGSVFTSGSVTDAGNGWYLVKGNYTPASDNATARQYINLSDTFEARNVSIGDSFYIWGAHLYRSDLGGMVDNPDRGDSYVPTTTSARYLPRIGHHVYNGSQWVDEGLLHESESRTNLVTYSEDFTDASWAKTRSLIALDAVGPDGQANSAATLSDDSSTGNNDVRLQVNCTVSTTTAYTFSIFAKADQLSWMALRTTDFTTPSNQYSYFDLSSGTLGTIGADHTATIEDVGNNWYRCSITFTTDASDTTGAVQIFLADADGDPNVDLDGTSSILIYGAQFEAGSTPSSYIPTTSGATVTRAAETLTIPYENLTWPEPEYISDELVTNGTFDGDLSGWTLSGSPAWVSGRAELSRNGGIDIVRQSFATTIGAVYKVTADVTGTSAKLGIGVSALDDSILNAGALVNTSVDRLFVATTNPTWIYLITEVNGTSSWDNVSVREIKPLSVSMQMDGRMTYADDGLSEQASFIRWRVSASDYINIKLDTSSTDIGQIYFQQLASGVNDPVLSASDTYSPDILVPFNISSRHGSTFINGAVDGVALTANTTPVALPDLSTTDLSLGYNFMGTIKKFRMWADDIGDTGIEEATEPSTQATLFLSFDGFDHTSYIDFDWSE